MSHQNAQMQQSQGGMGMGMGMGMGRGFSWGDFVLGLVVGAIIL